MSLKKTNPEMVGDDDTDTDEEGGSTAIPADMLAALQERLSSMASVDPSAFVHSLPKDVQRRIKALKKLQSEIINVESEFYQDMHKLEIKYAQKYTEFCEKRKDVVSAAVEPTDEDCDWPSDEEVEDNEDEELAIETKDKMTIEEAAEEDKKKSEEFVKGIPNFWLHVLKNSDMVADYIQEHDEVILTHLVDVKVVVHDTEDFTLEFHFEPNDYFSNSVLTKKYGMRYKADPDKIFEYEGPEIVHTTGCTISWKEGKNVTMKMVKKKQKSKGKTRTVTKQVKRDSFFNFFSPPEVPEGTSESDLDEETDALLNMDYEVGHFMRVRLVPRAVLYFTGEANDDDEDDDEDIDDFDEEDDEDDEEMSMKKGGVEICPETGKKCKLPKDKAGG